MSEEKLEEIGEVAHYFTNIGVAVVDLTGELSVGDRIAIKGATTDFEQTVESMQIEHEDVETAKPGQSIGMKVKNRTRENDVVYKIV
ncbi:translation elongation factor-like protein [Candidatus Bathyarchaeota archaeon]|nr:translation elongation factor-like protein [Candidatus Bathyarchaeota archaeon]NIR13198.1 translation elongation factor-like protein [Desulfobacterales bacterium]NIU81252.1 translation elongation factor-like protein [Candidatus Bathyarchaeota archaeon]NIV67516.1 translation elongation factor-like protein [Candidatus Bathyarchaeota archaeon]NIW16346.1 translation elongation factor-like protein [Candidatus Bathyarchaeota archaeon]